MRFIPIAFITLFALAGCSVGNDSLYTGSVSEKNINNLARLDIGMNQAAVLQIMRKPYDSEVLQIGSDSYELWYYITSVTGLGQTRMVAQNLTPLAFKNGTLIGWGYDYYRWLMKQEGLERQAQKKAALPQEDKALEKALKTTTPSNSAPTSVPTSTPQVPIEKAIEATSGASSPLSMSRAPAKPKENETPPEKKKPPLKPEDEEMLEEESEQNFNYW